MINVLMSRGIINKDYMYYELKQYIKPNSKVCILSFSFFNFHINSKDDWNSWYEKGSHYYLKMIDAFSIYGISEENITFLNYYEDSKDVLINKINNSDILYIPGGAPDQMYERIRDRDLLPVLQNYNKVVIGSSAGAMIQFDQYHISKDREYNKFQIHEGLNYINTFGIEVHFKPRKQQKKGIRKVSKLINRPVFSIPDDSAIIYNKKTNQVKLIKNAKMYYQNGKKVK